MIADGVQLDTVKFLKTSMERILKDIDHAYPGGYLDKDRAHVSLSMARADVRLLQKFIESLEPVQA